LLTQFIFILEMTNFVISPSPSEFEQNDTENRAEGNSTLQDDAENRAEGKSNVQDDAENRAEANLIFYPKFKKKAIPINLTIFD